MKKYIFWIIVFILGFSTNLYNFADADSDLAAYFFAVMTALSVLGIVLILLFDAILDMKEDRDDDYMDT